MDTNKHESKGGLTRIGINSNQFAPIRVRQLVFIRVHSWFPKI
jgi:hypothetical protein